MAAIETLTIKDIAARAGRVAVLMGGRSAEREISLKSGRAVFDALARCGCDAVALDWTGDLLDQLGNCRPDRVFIALHGRGGEDGTVQGLLEIMGIPYTGSDVLGSALSMDKVRSKQVWQSLGLPTPAYLAFRRGDAVAEALTEAKFPAMVKPAREGSSIGATRVARASELEAALTHALSFDDVVLIEQWIIGGEYTLGIVGGEPLPLIKLETPREFYDYEAKYLVDTTRYLCPCGLDAERIQQCTEIGMRAFDALGASGWGRVDFMLDESGSPWLIELNTVPGMTDHSLVPMAAAAAGIDFDHLVMKILAATLRES